ncbi:hypothetical protein MMC28_007000 [Mycoblastus sanguinarius]|nr:hypothetical protein [Mycoblastus sanguinarius]
MTKTALITGCSLGGIGDALAQEFHKRGVRVFATARNLAKVEHLRAMGLDVLKLDVLSPESIQMVVADVRKTTGGTLDFLVNNAGAGSVMPLLDADLKTAREIYDLNVFSVLAVTQAFAPSLIAAKGKVINIGSIVGRMAQAYTGIYNSSKAATNLLSETLRLELAPFNVQVITVVTGTVKTQFFASQPSAELPKGSLYLPVLDDIQKAATGEATEKDAMERSVFAAGFVANAMKTKSDPWYWRGTNTRLVWFVTTFFRHTYPDSIFYKSSGLNKLER